MATPTHPDLDRAFRLVAGVLPPTSDTDFDDPTAHEPGFIDKRVLLQATWWYDIRAHRHRLDAMSPDYRANVLADLAQEGPVWLNEAVLWVAADVLRHDIPPAEASDRLELLDLLTPGWTGHTPLGRRLHQLNATAPHGLEPPPTLLGPSETARPQILRDRNHGSWRVTTASTTTYLIDLDHRRIARHPGSGAGIGTGSGPPAPAVNISSLPFDGEWTHLTGLVQCRFGRSLFILDERPTGAGYRISTPVTMIEERLAAHNASRGDPGGR
jgi:hypothetical protein